MGNNSPLFRRHLAEGIESALDDTPAVLVAGARQAGKTTLCESIAGRRNTSIVTFDDAATLSAAKADPQGFITTVGSPVFLDEIQRVPEILLAIKLAIDKKRRPGHFLMTGSANVLTLPRVSESLAGRMEVLTLWPLSVGETEAAGEGFVDAVFAKTDPVWPKGGLSREPLLDMMLRGGYPEVFTREEPARRNAWFASYITTILQRDVRDIASIAGLTEMPRLLQLLAARASSILNVAELSRSSALPHTTLMRYLSLLEMIFLIHWIPAWSGSQARRLIKAPRLIFVDTGLLGYLTGFSRDRQMNDPGRIGPMLENFVAVEILKQFGWNRTRANLLHFRSHAGREVDFVLEAADGTVVGIEVKASTNVVPSDFKGLDALRETTGRRFRRGIILYTGERPLPFGNSCWAVPISTVWRLTSPKLPGRPVRIA